MPIADLADLVAVDLTTAWANEPHDFTPWLASNLDRVSKVIGVPVSEPETEVRVDRFAADIVARTPDGDKVLIENQFTKSDHLHLGQIMTYLAGTGAKIIVWIAPEFTDAHLSAVRWLNDHTTEDFSFFAVRLSVMQIGSSPLAPRFEVVEQPNNWDRKVQVSIRSGSKVDEPSERIASWRRQFWNRYIEKFPASRADRGAGGHGAARWRDVQGTGFIVSRWLTQNNIGVFVRGDRGTAWNDVSRLLENDLDRLEQELEANAEAGSSYPFLKYGDIDISQRENWDRAIDWLESQTQHYASVFARFAPQQNQEGNN